MAAAIYRSAYKHPGGQGRDARPGSPASAASGSGYMLYRWRANGFHFRRVALRPLAGRESKPLAVFPKEVGPIGNSQPVYGLEQDVEVCALSILPGGYKYRGGC